jgi:tetratricopeptide (TPR) repeat protein
VDEIKTIRIFISSPGDVADERCRAALVLGRLKRDYARFFKISPELWEYEPMLASGTFQDVIIEPAATDIVILILWSRLGTPLPPHTTVRKYQGIDGRTPVTGTEWEFENALRAARDKQARDEPPTPDILVYKKDVDGVARGKTAAKLEESVHQMAALEKFWARYFQNQEGQFTLAFNSFTSLDRFEQQLEAHLRSLLQKRIELQEIRPAVWPGEPFLGLRSFEFEHANIFFGRASAVQEITEALIARAQNANAFILVAGASGCGKSSLVKAGVVPSLIEPGVVLDTHVWRRCVFRPAGAGTLADRLASALIGESSLPELTSLAVTLEGLSNELKRGEILSLRQGLVEAARRASSTSNGSFQMGRLILVIDQLEELFTESNLLQAEREWFIDLLIKLSQSGYVWVIATMRSDFFAQMAALPRLRDQCSGSGLYHLLPPRPEEIDQIISLPADAAGISFDVDPRSGIGLDQELRSAASSNPYSLPLLEFTLDELYRRDILARGGRILRFATYRDELKKLEGAIAARAEVVCAEMPVRVQEKALPELLIQLVSIGEDDKPTAHFVPSSELSTTPERQIAIESLINSRLLVIHDQNEVPVIGVVHEALITSWPYYHDLVSKHVHFLRARGRISAQAKLWQSENYDSSRLLAPGLALEEGRSLLARRDELGSSVEKYIETSINFAEQAERRKRRLLMTVAGVAVVMALIFAGLADFARRASVRAQSNFEAATTALSTLIESVPEDVQPVAPLGTVKILMDQARKAISMFPPTEGTTPQIRRYRAEISLALAAVEFDLGHFHEARDLGSEAETILSDVAKNNSTDLAATYFLARSKHIVGETYYQIQDDKDGSKEKYKDAVSILESLIHDHESDPDAWLWHLSLADIHLDYGDLYLDRFRDGVGAKAEFDLAFQERKIVSQLGHGGPALDQAMGWNVNKFGDVFLRSGDRTNAIADFEDARDRIAALDKHLFDNKRWASHLAAIFNNVGLLMRDNGRYKDAVGQFDNAIKLTVEQTNRDPENTDLQSVLGWSYDNAGETLLRWAKSQIEDRQAHLKQADGMLTEAKKIREALAKSNKPQWIQDLIYTEANITISKAIALEMINNNLGAAAEYVDAAKRNQVVAIASQRDDATVRSIEFYEWAASAFTRAGAPGEARKQLTQAIEIARNHVSIAGDINMVSIVARLQGALQEIKN